jgi:histidine triad (HIT) family protein
MASIFSKIVAGEIPCFKVAETDDFLAFLDVFPLKKGHVLVIPKTEVDYIYDLDDDTLSALNLFAKKVAIGIKKAIPCKRIGTAVIGLEVPHVHIHLVPINEISDLSFDQPKLTFTEVEFAETARFIKESII